MAPEIARMVAGKSLVIFDFDGTLADSSPLHARAFAQVLAPLGVAVDYPRIMGMRTDAAMRQCLAEAGLDPDDDRIAALVAAKQALGRKLIARELRAFAQADALVRALRGQVRLALVSSGSRATVVPAAAQLGYAGWFDPLICGDDVAQAKPDPQGFLMALAQAGVAAHQALVLEDSPAGFAAALAAGIGCVDVSDWDRPRLMEGAHGA